jgi:hypothetical protein
MIVAPGMTITKRGSWLVACATIAPLLPSAVADAAPAAIPTPPKGCKTVEAYTGNGGGWVKMELCFTQADKHLASGVVWPNEPADTVWARCSGNRGSGLWDSKPCRVTSQLTLKKDGVEAWTEDRAFSVARDSGGNTYADQANHAPELPQKWPARLPRSPTRLITSALTAVSLTERSLRHTPLILSPAR